MNLRLLVIRTILFGKGNSDHLILSLKEHPRCLRFYLNISCIFIVVKFEKEKVKENPVEVFFILSFFGGLEGGVA